MFVQGRKFPPAVCFLHLTRDAAGRILTVPPIQASCVKTDKERVVYFKLMTRSQSCPENTVVS
jgi:hypothetical protein